MATGAREKILAPFSATIHSAPIILNNDLFNEINLVDQDHFTYISMKHTRNLLCENRLGTSMIDKTFNLESQSSQTEDMLLFVNAHCVGDHFRFSQKNGK